MESFQKNPKAMALCCISLEHHQSYIIWAWMFYSKPMEDLSNG